MYFPKNKIITNQYTKGGEYEFDSIPGPEYVGFYYKLYNGEVYSGKTPEDPTTELLILIEGDTSNQNQLPSLETTRLALSFGDADFLGDFLEDGGEGSIISGDGIGQYLSILKTSPNSRNTKYLPSQYYPKPTEDDYKVGNFKRYFCVKVNEDIYLELDQKTYDKISSQSPDWTHELYTPFYIMWYITGKEEQVEKTNENQVKIQQQRSRRKGLKEFLRDNYTKFWLPQ
jgi:hypothetical protein